MTRNVLITGGCGFIGTNLIARLGRSGRWRVTVLDNESIGHRGYLDGLDVARFVPGDVRDPEAVEAAMAGTEAVVHLAAQTGVVPSVEDPETDFDINVRGGLNVLQAAVQNDARAFVFASSAAPVGARQPPLHEDMGCRPAAPYGASKLAIEGYCSAFWHSYGLPTTTLRFSNCYGPGSDNKSSVVAAFIRGILAGKPLTIYGDGEQTRDFIIVDDICRGIELPLEGVNGRDDDLFGEVYQLSTGRETTVNRLVEMLQSVAREAGFGAFDIRHAPERKGEIARNYAKNDKFFAAYGYRPETPLDEGLARVWDFFTAQLVPHGGDRE